MGIFSLHTKSHILWIFFKSLCKRVEKQKGLSIVCVRSDHGEEEFENALFQEFCETSRYIHITSLHLGHHSKTKL